MLSVFASVVESAVQQRLQLGPMSNYQLLVARSNFSRLWDVLCSGFLNFNLQTCQSLNSFSKVCTGQWQSCRYRGCSLGYSQDSPIRGEERVEAGTLSTPTPCQLWTLYLLLLDDLYESLVCLARFKNMTIRMIRTSLRISLVRAAEFFFPPGRWTDDIRCIAGWSQVYTPMAILTMLEASSQELGCWIFSNLCEDHCDKVTNMSKGRRKDKPLRTDIDMSEIFVSNYTTKVSGQLYRLYSFHATCHVRSCRRTFPWRIKWGTCTGCAWASGVKSWGTQDARIPH